MNDINETLSEVVKLIDDITDEASTGAENAIKSLDLIVDGENAVDTQVRKMNESISVQISYWHLTITKNGSNIILANANIIYRG